MASHNQTPSSQSPTTAIMIGLAMIMFFCTVLWIAARRQVANIYGVLRSIEFPVIWRYMPGSENFDRSVLIAGHKPTIDTIYLNSVAFGLFFIAMMTVLMLLAFIRLEKYSIDKHLTIKSDAGLSYKDVMSMYAETEPSVRFYKNFDLLALSTIEGDGRQPMRAMEVIEGAGALKGLHEDYSSGRPASLLLDQPKLEQWFEARMGPDNPFRLFQVPKLTKATEIHEAVDALSWTAALILYPALWRKHSFLIDDKAGFETTVDDVDDFIDRIWSEINAFKDREGDRLVLGFDNDDQRRIQTTLFEEKRTSGRKKKRRKKDVAQDPAASGLITLGELLDMEGPDMAVVAEAKEGLKRILTRHLGVDTGEYPVSTDDDGLIVYGPKAKTPSEQAFMDAKSKQLKAAADTISKESLFAHHYLYGLVGGALEAVRQTGIMPALEFRWLRFYDKPFWYFIQNLGMPSAYPENAASFEHFQAERAARIALSVPYIKTSIAALQVEAEKYLVDEEMTRIREQYGSETIRETMTELSKVSPLEELLKGGAAGGAVLKAVASETTKDTTPATASDHEEVQLGSVVDEVSDDPEAAMLKDSRKGLGKFF